MSDTDDSADANTQHDTDSTASSRVLTVDPERVGERITVASTTGNSIQTRTHEARVDTDGTLIESRTRTAFMADSYEILDE